MITSRTVTMSMCGGNNCGPRPDRCDRPVPGGSICLPEQAFECPLLGQRRQRIFNSLCPHRNWNRTLACMGNNGCFVNSNSSERNPFTQNSGHPRRWRSCHSYGFGGIQPRSISLPTASTMPGMNPVFPRSMRLATASTGCDQVCEPPGPRWQTPRLRPCSSSTMYQPMR